MWPLSKSRWTLHHFLESKNRKAIRLESQTAYNLLLKLLWNCLYSFPSLSGSCQGQGKWFVIIWSLKIVTGQGHRLVHHFKWLCFLEWHLSFSIERKLFDIILRPICGGGGAGRGVQGVWTHPLAGQIISKSCRFSQETEFIPLILSSKSVFS